MLKIVFLKYVIFHKTSGNFWFYKNLLFVFVFHFFRLGCTKNGARGCKYFLKKAPPSICCVFSLQIAHWASFQRKIRAKHVQFVAQSWLSLSFFIFRWFLLIFWARHRENHRKISEKSKMRETIKNFIKFLKFWIVSLIFYFSRKFCGFSRCAAQKIQKNQRKNRK